MVHDIFIVIQNCGIFFNNNVKYRDIFLKQIYQDYKKTQEAKCQLREDLTR